VAILRAILAGVWAFPEGRWYGLRRAWKRCGRSAVGRWLLTVGNEARSAESYKIRAHNLLICVA